MTEPEREAALAASIQHVRAKILAVDPTSIDVGGIFDTYGEAKWTPSRSAGLDYSLWGDWEAWEHQRTETVTTEGQPAVSTLVPSGEWACWNAVTNEGFVYTPGPNGARARAETFCVGMNAGKQTRVVSANGTWRASAVSITSDQRAQVEAASKD